MIVVMASVHSDGTEGSLVERVEGSLDIQDGTPVSPHANLCSPS